MALSIPHFTTTGIGQKLRVLLADDSLELQALIRFYLHGTHYHVDIVSNGAQAVAAFQAEPFDLVLIDQHMPGMDGFTATRLIRAWESSTQRSSVPILALTANTLSEANEQSRTAGCTAFLAKPITKTQLLTALQTHCTTSPTTIATTTQGKNFADVTACIEEELLQRRPLFLDNRRKDLDKMRHATAQEDFETIRTMGHRMKGLAGSYGFPDIGLAGERLEQAAVARDLTSVRREIDQLAAILARISQAA